MRNSLRIIEFRTTLAKCQARYSVDTKMTAHYMFNSALEITCLHHVAYNPLLRVRSATDLLHLTRYFL